MKVRTSILIYFVILVCINPLRAELVDSIKYSEDFVFNEGVYLSIEDWKNNDPLRIEKIITEHDKSDLDFYYRLFQQKEIIYRDKYDKVSKIKIEKTFGYCRDNIIYTPYHCSIPIIGSICYFANLYNKNLLDKQIGWMVIGPFSRPNKLVTDIMIIDFERNAVYPFKKRAIEFILKRDKQLYKEYKKAKGKRKDKMYLYMMKYNEKHPVYFPR